MTGRPTRIAQTSTEAKKLHRRSHVGLSERQQRQIEREAELENRAHRLREAEERRKAAKKKREIREKREVEARKQAGVGLATQLIGYSRTQAQLKNGMEAFLGIKKKRQEERLKELEVSRCLESLVDEDVKEPWDDDDFDLPDLPASGGEQSVEDELDDDTLLQIHDQVMSDPVDVPRDDQQARVSIPAAVPPNPSPNMERAAFIRLHGPVNKAIEEILSKLPEPLIELLSQDSSVNAATWDPAPSLLHKLNPLGLPPHRLRIKVGCVVTLLRDLNNGNDLSGVEHFRILGIEEDRLECLALDGPLQGSRTFFTRITFPANHRNDQNCAFKRVQFPLQVSKDWAPPETAKEGARPTFKVPAIPKPSLRPSSGVAKNECPSAAAAKATITNSHTPFKIPGPPAEKTKSDGHGKVDHIAPLSIFDGWDDFLDTGTQIARELSSEPSSSVSAPPPSLPGKSAPTSHDPPTISTEVLNSLAEDSGNNGTKSIQAPQKTVSIATATHPSEAKPPLTNARPRFQKKSPFPRTEHPVSSKHRAITPAAPGQTLKRRLPEAPVEIAPIPAKKVAVIPVPRPTVSLAGQSLPKTAPMVVNTPLRSFGEFGLSTQEALSFFDDDDEVMHGSPPIAV